LRLRVAIIATVTIPAGNPMIQEIQILNLSQYYGSYVKKNGYDPFIAKEIIEERIGRKIICECQILNGDEKEIRRMTLQKIFGADFGGPGRRDFDLI